MALMGRRLAVSIPDTVLEEKQSLREKTAKLGLIARACAIYGVDVIEVFRDPGGRGEAGTICKVLEYLETPQYLRKRLYPLDETLRFAGVLPPLRTPSHKPRVPVERISVGEVREGVANGDGTVDVGLEVAPRLKGKAPAKGRVTVRINSLSPLSAEVVSRGQEGEYWGYNVEARQLGEVIEDTRFKVKIATSRRGIPLPDALGTLRSLFRGSDSVKLIYGSPTRGLYDIIGEDLERKVGLVLNLIPEQQVETVRTEEALFACLGLVNVICAEKA